MSLSPSQLLEHKFPVEIRSEFYHTKLVPWHKLVFTEEVTEWLDEMDQEDYILVRRAEQPQVLFKDEIMAVRFKLAFG